MTIFLNPPFPPFSPLFPFPLSTTPASTHKGDFNCVWIRTKGIRERVSLAGVVCVSEGKITRVIYSILKAKGKKRGKTKENKEK